MQRQLSGMINSDLGFDRQNILRLYTGWKVMPGMDATYNYRGIFEDLPGEFRKEAGAGIVDAIAMDMDIFSRVTYHKIEIMPEEQWMSMKDKMSPVWRDESGGRNQARRVCGVSLSRHGLLPYPYGAREETGGISRTGRGVASAVQPRIHGTLWGCLPAWGKTLYRRDTGERQ